LINLLVASIAAIVIVFSLLLLLLLSSGTLGVGNKLNTKSLVQYSIIPLTHTNTHHTHHTRTHSLTHRDTGSAPFLSCHWHFRFRHRALRFN